MDNINASVISPELIISLENSLKLNRNETRSLHKNYGNSSLVTLMGLLNFDRQFIRAEGTRVWDSDGTAYLDFLGGYGSLNLGHNHPHVISAVERVREIPNILQVTVPTVAGALLHNLAVITPGQLKRSFLCNSGAEAVEGALKLARAATGRKAFIYCQNSFHGKSFGALSVTGREKYRTKFEPLLPECVEVPYGDNEALRRALISNQAAAFIVEPIQGEGGINLPPEGYLTTAARDCRENGTLFIADEIQTGFGRTGKMFACQHDNVEPDIMCLAKSLGGGIMPIGAFITTEEIWQKAYGTVEKATLHTSTFGGNTRAAAAGIAAIEVLLAEKLDAAAAANGSYFISGLLELQKKYSLIKEVRGRGLLIGVEFTQPGGLTDKATLGLASKLSNEYLGSMVAGELLNRHHIITAYTLNNPNVIRLEPPLTVTREDLDYVLNALDSVLKRNKGFWGFTAASAKTVIKRLTSK